jgi:thymidylate kinase
MIIEFTGPSGCGKTTAIYASRDFLLEKGISPLVIAEGESTTKFQINECITDSSKHGIRTDLTVFFPALFFFLINIRFTFFIIRNVFKLSGGASIYITVLRSVWRKIGILAYLKKIKYKSLVVLFDEGSVHSAHNVLVDVSSDVDVAAIKEFSKLTPFADITVIQTASESILVKRIHERGDWSPRVNNEEELNKFTKNSVRLYKNLSKELQKSPTKLLVINSMVSTPKNIAEQLSSLIWEINNK